MSPDASVRRRVNELVEALAHLARRYYIDGVSEASDAEYDGLYRELVALEEEHPELVRPDSPNLRVGAPLPEGQGFRRVEHAVPMLSIESLFDDAEVLEFEEKVRRFLGLEEDAVLDWRVEPKLDGVSASLLYENGRLVRAVTRGDGQVGEDVTANLRTVRNLPLVLQDAARPLPELLEVRGEVLIRRGHFDDFNERRRAAGRPILANPRNATAGAVRRNDPAEVAHYPLELVCWEAPRIEGAEVPTATELAAALADWGLPDSGLGKRVQGAAACVAYHDELEARREELSWEIDGVVCKLDRFDLRERLGRTARATRWQFAHKFAAVEAVSTLRAIEVQVGANGRLTPRAHVEPVEVMGVTVRHATLHNAGYVEALGVVVGDRVFVKRAGDVIPQITGVAAPASGRQPKGWADSLPETARDAEGEPKPGVLHGWREPFAMPTRCPACGSEVLAEGRYFRCPNVHGCRPQLVGRSLVMAGRAGFEIDELGEKMVEQLFDVGYMRSPADLFLLDQLPREDLVGLERWGEKSVDNLLGEIEAARHVPLPRFLAALGIPDVGPATGRLLAGHFDLDALRAADPEALESIDGIGPEVARKIRAWFDDPLNEALLEKLLGPGRVAPRAPAAAAADGAFAGKTVVFTGTLESMTRSEAKKTVEEQGGRVVSSVSGQTDFLIQGGKAGSKARKAEELGVAVLLEADFLARLGRPG